MLKRGAVLIAMACIAGFVGHARAADCTQRAAPGVDWQRCFFDDRDLAGQNLARAHVVETSFARAVLTGVDLTGADGYRAKFISAAMAKTHLDNGNFAEADFTKADLGGASLKNADLRRAHFFKANLKGADLSGARMLGADLLNADLSGATWTDGKRICAAGSTGECN